MGMSLFRGILLGRSWRIKMLQFKVALERSRIWFGFRVHDFMTSIDSPHIMNLMAFKFFLFFWSPGVW